MERHNEQDELIDLGPASLETKGTSFGREDTAAGLIPVMGLSDE